MPPLGDIAYATGACSKCDDDNPLRSYRIVARFDTVVHVLYAWGRDSGSNFDVVMYLANKLPKHLGSVHGAVAGRRPLPALQSRVRRVYMSASDHGARRPRPLNAPGIARGRA